MAICDFMMMAGWYFPFLFPSPAACTFQAYSLEFFAQGSMVWTSIFAIRIYLTNVKEDRNIRLDNIVSHIFGWGIPLVLSICAGAFKLFGRAGAWCWIDDSHPREQIFMGDGLSVIMFAIEVIVFSSLMYKLRAPRGIDARMDILRRTKRKVLLRFALFLAIPPICWTFGLANRMVGYLKHEELRWLEVMQAVCNTSQGFLNALIYGYDPELRTLWMTFLLRIYSSEKTEKKPLVPKKLFTSGKINEDLQRIEVNVNELYDQDEIFRNES
eukprot:Phypoly_transcript_14852.p1 GENE.Phypoly_transcript_14852~~Phypoly_transcript_14852.p1  ORF type:complete len:306 (+),score=34.96 Phypoly_transcript_14852:110-919(+)